MARARKTTLDRIKMEIGAEVKELLFEKFRASKKLELVKLDAKAWPGIADWVTSYTTYDIG